MGFAQNMRITAHADYQSTKTYAQPNTRRKIAPFCFQLSAGNTQNKKSLNNCFHKTALIKPSQYLDAEN